MRGCKYEFVYAESSTKPNALADLHHIPVRPTIDFFFFRFLQSHNIPIGLFYRDIYWKFDLFQKELGFWKANLSKLWFLWDLWQYEKYVDRIYLPSINMADYVPIVSSHKMDILPPGCDARSPSETLREKRDKIQLLYVGGIGQHYELRLLFEMLQGASKLELTICTREPQWLQFQTQYVPLLNENIHIVHKTNKETKQLYKNSDIAVLFVKPQLYREFAVPFKLFEYIGHGKPVLASASTLVGQMVEEMGIGWAVPYSKESLKIFLQHIQNNPDEIREKEKKAKSISKDHTWLARAQKVAKDFHWQP